MRKLGIVLIIASFVPWLSAFAVPFLALSATQKITIAPILFGVGEVMFWIGVLIVGKEVADRYRRWLDPRFVWRKLTRRR